MDRRFQVGDKVTPDPAAGVPIDTIGRVFTVVKRNPKNVKCSADDGGRGLNFPDYALLPYTGELPTPAAPEFSVEFFRIGEIVTLKRAFGDATPDTPMIVLADKGNKVNVARLGGDNDRYVRVPRSGLVKRDVNWLTEQLAA